MFKIFEVNLHNFISFNFDKFRIDSYWILMYYYAVTFIVCEILDLKKSKLKYLVFDIRCYIDYHVRFK